MISKTKMNTVARRGALAGAMCLLLAGAMCAPGTGEASKSVAVGAIEDFLTSPLGNAAPLSGVVMNSADLSKEAARRTYEARGTAAEIKAIEADSMAEREKYEAESAVWDAARRGIATGNYTGLDKAQEEYRRAAKRAERRTQPASPQSDKPAGFDREGGH